MLAEILEDRPASEARAVATAPGDVAKSGGEGKRNDLPGGYERILPPEAMRQYGSLIVRDEKLEARRREHLERLYGGPWPRFQMTLSGVWAWRYDDRQFFGLVDHECCHAGVARDPEGAPKFNDRTEEPVWSLRAHDVEQFVGTVRRWGAPAAGVAEMVEAAALRPRFEWVPGTEFSPIACATCRGAAP